MKTKLVFGILLAAVVLAYAQAPWDGTRGNITISTTGDLYHTVITVNDPDCTVLLFGVTTVFSTNEAYPPRRTRTVYVSRSTSPAPCSPVLAVFDIPIALVLAAQVVEYQGHTPEFFGYVPLY